MGTVIDQIAVVNGGWRNRHSALRLIDRAAKKCLRKGRRNADDVDLLVNAGIYRDRNLGEPALASMIQDDIGANDEEPHTGGHGTFSFDVANGSCGMLTALHIVDGFLKSRVIDCALVVAGDADPGRGSSEAFPYSPAGASLLCGWSEDGRGLGPVWWERSEDDDDTVSATIAMVEQRNLLRIRESVPAERGFARTAARAAQRCLTESDTGIDEIASIVAAPASPAFRAELASQLNVPLEHITVGDDQHMHTAALAAALGKAADTTPPDSLVMIIAAGAGVTAGAALYRM
ncbi:3-oxoacyl-ACP synthase [Mycolicibacterium novocastrense]|uniref:3-oxoacyl-(Acyl-carrier-protein) synthase III n=1 Tax=Mycolicibacterium novocastrense TaxID=59813 RepID=A0AAW5SEH4_MYCNV|nr:3-oxoacyl-ACP synthase [Mycolicibacterium novocastrense]MCV7022463.1 3-oxoacyl-ACP synthase [Mycolicibacterium novocastrense]GAT08126.1 3-oxoacyl-(Acyl-carrier-protein) synthase III, precursor [Mycolicibacterium novocastrense]